MLSAGVIAEQIVPKVKVITKKYNVKDGLLISRISNAIIDKQGFIWIATKKGIQFWDGEEFITALDAINDKSDITLIYAHPVKGIYCLSSDRVYALAVDSHEPEILIDKSEANLKFPISLIRKLGNTEIICDDTVYIFDRSNRISKEFKRAQKPYKNEWYSYYLNESKDTIVRNFIKGISYKKENEKCFNSSLANNTLEASSFDKCYSLDYEGLIIDEILFPFPNEFVGQYHLYLYPNSSHSLLLGVDNHLYEFDLKEEVWIREFVNEDGKVLLENGFVDRVFQDSFDNYWIVTVNDGLLKFTENRVFKYFGRADKSTNFVKNIAVNKPGNQVVIAGLNNGLLLFDTLANFQGTLISEEFSLGNVLGIYHIEDDRFIINMHKDEKLYELVIRDVLNFTLKKIGTKKTKSAYYQCSVQLPDNNIMFGFSNVLLYDRSLQTFTEEIPIGLQINCGLFHNDKVYFGSDNILFVVTYPEMELKPEIEVQEMGYIRGMAGRSSEEIYLAGDAGLGIYNVNKDEIKWLYKDATVYSLVVDSYKTLWMGTDKGLVSMDSLGEFEIFLPEDGIQGNEFNTNAFDISENGEIFMGGMNGVTSFYPESISKPQDSLFLFYKSVLVNNEAIQHNVINRKLLDISLKYNENSIIVDLGLLGSNESNYYEYSYQILGEDSKWISNANNSKFLFNLSPGEYEIKFKAGNPYQFTSSQFLVLNLKIFKPWWRTYLFYFLLALFFGGIIFMSFYFINKQKIQKAQYEWDVKYKLQEERINLSRDIHDHIGSQLSYLVSSIDNIDMSKDDNLQKVAHLSQYSRKIISDLRSLIWVLNKDEITIEELVLKILDLIQIIQHSQETITVNFESTYNENNPEIMEAKLAGNIFRVVQELLHNTIKHAEAKEIHLYIEMMAEELKLHYKDDGNGFDENQENSGNGLTNIKSRVGALNGSYKLESTEGKGVFYQFTIPRNTKNSV